MEQWPFIIAWNFFVIMLPLLFSVSIMIGRNKMDLKQDIFFKKRQDTQSVLFNGNFEWSFFLMWFFACVVIIAIFNVPFANYIVMIGERLDVFLDFSIKDICSSWYIFEMMLILIISFLTIGITTLTFLSGGIKDMFDYIRFMALEIAMIFNLLSGGYIIYVMIRILFSNKGWELITCTWQNEL